MKVEVDPSVLAESFVGAVTLAARELADRIEQVVEPQEAWSAEHRSEMMNFTLTSIKFVLEATERIASAYLSPAEREQFMLMVGRLTVEGGGDESRSARRATGRNGSRLRVVASQAGKAGGVVLWEFAKSVCRHCSEMTPPVATILSLVAANTFEALASAVEHGAERQTASSEAPDWTSERAALVEEP